MYSKSMNNSTSSRISADHMRNIVEKLKCQRVRNTTTKNYQSVWCQFNSFLIRLDKMPKDWEDRAALFCAYLIEKGIQSSTIKSYVSAIKALLKDDNYKWMEGQVLLSTLTRACKIRNDRVRCRLPIHKHLFKLILFELNRSYHNQSFLCCMYKAIFCLAFYGMMRIGELTQGDHPIKACDIHICVNKDKILIVLYTSKTHSRGYYPQKIKISSDLMLSERRESEKRSVKEHPTIKKDNHFFCPFTLIREYLAMHGGFIDRRENFFIFRDRSPVKPFHVRNILHKCLK